MASLFQVRIGSRNLSLLIFESWIRISSILGSPFLSYVNDLSRVTISENLNYEQVDVPLSFDVYHQDICYFGEDSIPLNISITGIR